MDEINEQDAAKPAKNGKIVPNLDIAVTILESDPYFDNGIWYDEFLNRFLTGNPPREWKDADDIATRLYIQRECGIKKISRGDVCEALALIATRNKRNCVKQWVESLQWDKTPRIEHMLSDHFGVDETAYTLAVSKNFWLSMIARIMKPGCQVDNMMVLIGKQGAKKSSALRIIGGDWFAEQHQDASNPKAFAEIIQGKILIEISEMDSFNKATITSVKQIVTCVSDRYRNPYDRHATDHPRQCIFAGTTNREDWGGDVTGARRFWPIRIPHGHIVDIAAIAKNREQYFAEALAIYLNGATWWEMPEEETEDHQSALYTPPAWVEPIQNYIEFEDNVRRVEPITELRISDIMSEALKLEKSQWNKGSEMRIAECLTHLGFSRKKRRVGTQTHWLWVKN